MRLIFFKWIIFKFLHFDFLENWKSVWITFQILEHFDKFKEQDANVLLWFF